VKGSNILSWAHHPSLTRVATKYAVRQEINERVALWTGNITCLEVDAIQNAANKTLLGGGGIDGAIHRAAGSELLGECRTLEGCETGNTKITKGYNLPSKHVLHTVGPVGENPIKLQSCYRTTLDLALQNNLKTIALCGVSTGIYGYPLEKASEVACQTVREWLEEDEHWEKIEKIIFVTFLPAETEQYEKVLPVYFPKIEELPEVEEPSKVEEMQMVEESAKAEEPSKVEESPNKVEVLPMDEELVKAEEPSKVEEQPMVEESPKVDNSVPEVLLKGSESMELGEEETKEAVEPIKPVGVKPKATTVVRSESGGVQYKFAFLASLLVIVPSIWWVLRARK